MKNEIMFNEKVEKEEERKSLQNTISNDQNIVDNFINQIYKNFIHETANIEKIDSLDGVEFENYIASFFKRTGYKIQRTPASGDNGIDLILVKDAVKIGVQCKRYAGNVSVSAIQEVYTGKDYYECNKALVITNSYFTHPAKNMANKLGVTLWDRDILIGELSSLQLNISWRDYLNGFIDFTEIERQNIIFTEIEDELIRQQSIISMKIKEEVEIRQKKFISNVPQIEKNQSSPSKHIRNCQNCKKDNWVYLDKINISKCGICKHPLI